MAANWNPSIRILVKSPAIQFRGAPPPPCLSRRLRIPYPHRHSSGTAQEPHHAPPPLPPKSPPYGIRRFLKDMNLGYSLPIGFLLSVALYAYLQSQLPEDEDGQGSSRATRGSLSSKEPLPPLIALPKPDDAPVLDPSTQIPFLAELTLSTELSQEPLRLIGVGVRTVSFLAIKVYSAGFYADPRVLRALRVVPGWNTDVTKEKLLAKATLAKSPSSPTVDDGEPATSAVVETPISGESLMRNLLSAPVQFAIRIAPARSTDFTHLRDGFCRSLSARVSHAAKQGLLKEHEVERASESIATFRTFFPAGVSVPKGKSLLLRRTPTHSLVIEYDGRTLGELKDPLIARELFLAYFADVDPISVKFKEAVAEGFENFYS